MKHRATWIVIPSAIIIGFVLAYLTGPGAGSLPEVPPAPSARETSPQPTLPPATPSPARESHTPGTTTQTEDAEEPSRQQSDADTTPPAVILSDVMYTGEQGEARLYPGARENFERALAAADGEEDIEQIAAELAKTIGGQAGEEAARLFRNYAEYRQQETTTGLDEEIYRVSTETGDLEMLETRLETQAAMRRQHFGHDAAEALFGEEEQFSRYQMEHLRLQQETDLDEETRREREQALLELLPERYREELQALQEAQAEAAGNDDADSGSDE